MSMKRILAVIFLMLIAFEAKAQYMEDGVRLLNTNGIISSRSGAMGVGFNGIVDDISSLYYNPAGLSLIPKSELSIGFGMANINNDNTFLGQMKSMDVNDEFISHIGVASPLRSNTGLNSVIAVGYFREASFDNNIKIEGFNSQSTYIRHNAESGGTSSIAHEAKLSNGSETPYQKDLQQSAFIDESGGMHNIVGGAGFELTEKFSIGFTLTGKWGSFAYSKDFKEIDVNNIYETMSDDLYGDLQQFRMKNHTQQDISGISGSFGLLAKPTNNSRISIGVKFPTKYSIDEEFYTDYYIDFDGENNYLDLEQPELYYSSYSIYTPFVYTLGASFNIVGLTTSIGLEYSDASQLDFSSSSADIDQFIDEINQYIIEDLGSQIKYGVAFEYEIPNANMFVRGGYTKVGSPYKDKDLYGDLDRISGGLGILVGKDLMLNFTFITIGRDEKRVLYGEESISETYTTYDVSNSNMYFGLGLNYRY